VLLDKNGGVCGKGGCGADHYSHIKLAGFERPAKPDQIITAQERAEREHNAFLKRHAERIDTKAAVGGVN
jgi:hypothetical protein